MSAIMPSYSPARSGVDETNAKLCDLSKDLDKFAPEHRSQVMVDRLRQQKLRAMISLAKAQQYLAETDVMIADYNLQAVAEEFEHMKKERCINNGDVRSPQISGMKEEKTVSSTDCPASSGDPEDFCCTPLVPAVGHSKRKEKGTEFTPKLSTHPAEAHRSKSKTDVNTSTPKNIQPKNKIGGSEPTSKEIKASSKTYEPITSKTYKESSSKTKEATTSKTYEASSSKAKEAPTSKAYDYEKSSSKAKEAATSKSYDASSSKVKKAATSKTSEASSSKAKEATTSKAYDYEKSSSKAKEAATSKSYEASSSKAKEAATSKTSEASSSKAKEAPTSKAYDYEKSSSKAKEATTSNTYKATTSTKEAASLADTDFPAPELKSKKRKRSKSKSKESKRHKSTHKHASSSHAPAESTHVPAASSNVHTTSLGPVVSSNGNTALFGSAASSLVPAASSLVPAASSLVPAASSLVPAVSPLVPAVSQLVPTVSPHVQALLSHIPNCDCLKSNRTIKQKTLLNTSISPIKKIVDAKGVQTDRKAVKNDIIQTDEVETLTKAVQTDNVIILHVGSQTTTEQSPDIDDEDTLLLETLPAPHSHSTAITLAKALEQIKSQKTSVLERLCPTEPDVSHVLSQNDVLQRIELIMDDEAETAKKRPVAVKMELPDEDIPNTSTEVLVNNLHKDIMNANDEEANKGMKPKGKVTKRGLWKILDKC